MDHTGSMRIEHAGRYFRDATPFYRRTFRERVPCLFYWYHNLVLSLYRVIRQQSTIPRAPKLEILVANDDASPQKREKWPFLSRLLPRAPIVCRGVQANAPAPAGGAGHCPQPRRAPSTTEFAATDTQFSVYRQARRERTKSQHARSGGWGQPPGFRKRTRTIAPGSGRDADEITH